MNIYHYKKEFFCSNLSILILKLDFIGRFSKISHSHFPINFVGVELNTILKINRICEYRNIFVNIFKRLVTSYCLFEEHKPFWNRQLIKFNLDFWNWNLSLQFTICKIYKSVLLMFNTFREIFGVYEVISVVISIFCCEYDNIS